MKIITLEKIVNQPINIVWGLITNPRKFYALRIPYTYGDFATGEPRVGSAFEMYCHGPTYIRYVVDCLNPTEFSFGSTETDWIYHFLLLNQNSKTLVKFSRKFKTTIGSTLTKYKVEKKLTLDTINAIEKACNNLANGKADGLTMSS